MGLLIERQIGHMPTLLKLRLHGFIFKPLVHGLEQYKLYSQIQAQERMQKNNAADDQDIFSYLLKAKDPETHEGFTESELTSESSLLIIAGRQLRGA